MKRMGKVIIIIRGLIALIVASVERDGDGVAKKEEAIEVWREMVEKIDRDVWDAPAWLVSILTSDVVAGFLIDVIVRNANRTGLFTLGDSQE